MIDFIEYIIEVREYGVTDEARKRYSITFLPMSKYSVGIGIAEFFYKYVSAHTRCSNYSSDCSSENFFNFVSNLINM